MVILFVVSVYLGNIADNKKPLSKLKRRDDTSRSEFYVTPSEFYVNPSELKPFEDESSLDISRVENDVK